MNVSQLCSAVRKTSCAIYRSRKSACLEKFYENALANRLRKQGYEVHQQHPLTVKDEDGNLLGDFRVDLLVERTLLVNLKTANHVLDEHSAQMLRCLRASQLEHGLLINFGTPKLTVRKFLLQGSRGESVSDSEPPRF